MEASKDMQGEKASYHHGNLREALICEAIAVIAEGDLQRLSLRGLARRIQVSPAAPYHHFSDKNALLCAIAKRGFEEMGAEMDRQLEHVARAWGEKLPRGKKLRTQRAEERLRALGAGYIYFAVANPVHYDLMFRADLVDVDGANQPSAASEPLATEASSCFMRLLDAVAELLGEEASSPLVAQRALICWSTVHGFSALWNHGAVAFKYPGMSLEHLVEAVTAFSVNMPVLPVELE